MLDMITRAVSRFDGWINTITGVNATGGRNDFRYSADARLTDQELEDLFHGDAYAKRICKAIPDHALRRPFKVQTGEPALDSYLSARLDELKAREKILEAWTWARLYGGAAIFVGADDGKSPAEPLDSSAVRGVRFLTVLDRRELFPSKYFDDPLTAEFGEPSVYQIQRVGGSKVDHGHVHATRLIRFEGAMTGRQRRQRNNGWSESELQAVMDKLTQFNGSFAGASTLLHDASQGVFKMQKLFELIASDRGDVVKRRMELMDLGRSSARALFIDAEEEFERVESGVLGGVPAVVTLFMQLLAGAAEMPVTVLMGMSPAGLNATGESDIRLWYDRVGSSQTNDLKPRAERLVRVLLRAKEGPAGGREPPQWSLVLPSLYQPTPAEEADLRQKQAQTDSAYITAQVLTAEEVAVSRFRPEGWSAETTIDLDARRAAMDADAAGLGAADPSAQLPAGAPSPAAEHSDDIAAVVDRVAARAIPRDAGIGQLTSLFGLSPEQAEATMGATGVTHFTAPEPGHAAELDAARAQAKQLEASNRGLRTVVARVLERNKRGELVLGNIFAGPPTETKEGDVLEEGDAVAVPAPTTLDARGFLRMDAGDGQGVAVVLPLPPDVAARVALAGGLPPGDLHVTLAYLGPASDLAPDALVRARAVVAGWAAAAAPIGAVLAGQGRFLAPGLEPDPVYLVPDECDLLSPAESLGMRLAAAGAPVRSSYAFAPHVTVAYLPKGAGSPAPPAEPVPVTFGEVALWVGADRERFSLAGQPLGDPETNLLAQLEGEIAGGA